MKLIFVSQFITGASVTLGTTAYAIIQVLANFKCTLGFIQILFYSIPIFVSVISVMYISDADSSWCFGCALIR